MYTDVNFGLTSTGTQCMNVFHIFSFSHLTLLCDTASDQYKNLSPEILLDKNCRMKTVREPANTCSVGE